MATSDFHLQANDITTMVLDKLSSCTEAEVIDINECLQKLPLPVNSRASIYLDARIEAHLGG